MVEDKFEMSKVSACNRRDKTEERTNKNKTHSRSPPRSMERAAAYSRLRRSNLPASVLGSSVTGDLLFEEPTK